VSPSRGAVPNVLDARFGVEPEGSQGGLDRRPFVVAEGDRAELRSRCRRCSVSLAAAVTAPGRKPFHSSSAIAGARPDDEHHGDGSRERDEAERVLPRSRR
jgi:hypothetical protein